MADGFDAGSILVTLRAQLDDFNRGITSAKATLDSLATGSKDVEVAFTELDTAVVVFQEIEAESGKVTQTFDQLNTRVQNIGIGAEQAARFFQSLNAETGRLSLNIKTTGDDVSITAKQLDEAEQATGRANISWARASNRILGVQIAMLSLTQHGTGPLKEAFQALSNGVSTAAAAFQLAQGKISLFGAGAIGVAAAAVSFFTRYLEENIKATDAMSDQMDKTRKATDAMRTSIDDARLTISVFGGTEADKLVAKLGIEEAAFASNAKRIREISDELRKLKAEQGVLYSADRTGQIESLEQERTNLNRGQDDIRKTGAFDRANADVAKLLQSTKDLNVQLEDVGIKGKASLEFGISTPLEVASKNAQEAKAYFEKLVDDNVKITEEANKYNISLEQRSEILKKLHPLDQLQGAAEDAKAKKLLDDQIRATDDLAKTFSTSVGDGLRDAILNAKKPMEALAGIGQNLFANMIDQTIKRLETGLTDAFKAITGAAGEGIGLAITGILGAAGAILSKLGSKGSDSFGNVQSAVTSTAAVRGIVAGPSSVAIATVGDNLSRAMVPVVTLLGIGNSLLQQIANNTRGGGRGGPGTSNVVQTA